VSSSSKVRIYLSRKISLIIALLRCSHHLLDEVVDEFFSVSESTKSLGESVSLDLKSSEWWGELEWPEEVVGLLEVSSTGDDFVDEVLNAVNTELGEFVGDDLVISQWDS